MPGGLLPGLEFFAGAMPGFLLQADVPWMVAGFRYLNCLGTDAVSMLQPTLIKERSRFQATRGIRKGVLQFSLESERRAIDYFD